MSTSFGAPAELSRDQVSFKTMSSIDALRISPKYTSSDWKHLGRHKDSDWNKASEIVRDRLDGRFLRFATKCLEESHLGFVVLAIDSLLIETIQQFKEGIINGDMQSAVLIKKFLEEEARFRQSFDNEEARKDFYKDIRCGLLHQAEAKKMWLIRTNEAQLLQKQDGGGYIIDVKRFHAALQGSLDDYLKRIASPSESELRSKLWTKMDCICNVREARGALYDAESSS